LNICTIDITPLLPVRDEPYCAITYFHYDSWCYGNVSFVDSLSSLMIIITIFASDFIHSIIHNDQKFKQFSWLKSFCAV